jgi:hypothetical protein
MVAAALLVGVVACGSTKKSGIPTANGGSGTATPKPTGSISQQDRQRLFAQCMRDHGVQMKDPEPGHPGSIGGQGGADDAKTKAALEACRQYMPNGGDLTKPDAQQIEQERKIAQCMRAHGVPKFPDPDPNAAGGQNLNSAGVDPNDPKFKAADEACRYLRPTSGPSGGGPAGAAGGPGQ